MTRRALLIGCSGQGFRDIAPLKGVTGSIARVRGALEQRDFTCDGELLDATAAAIRDALLRLCSAAQEGDFVVIVYVGHGTLVDSDGVDFHADEAARPRFIQALAPSDLQQSSAGDCRAITGLDLALALTAIVERGADVLLVLDCCHAGGMAAMIDPKCPITQAYDACLKEKIARAKGVVYRSGETAAALRFVGSATYERAYEVQEPETGQRIGAFSKAFAEALDEAPDTTPWWGLEAKVQARLLDLSRERQWVGVEGPRDRIMFTRRPAPLPAGGFPCAWHEGQLWLRGGFYEGVQRGDRYAIHERAAGPVLGTARVNEVRGSEAALTFPAKHGAALPAGAHAVPVRYKGAFPVRIEREAAHLGVMDPPLPGWRLTEGACKASIDVVDGRVVLTEELDRRARIVSRRLGDPDARVALRNGLLRIGAWLRVREAVVKDRWEPRKGELDLTRGTGEKRPSLSDPFDLVAGEPLRVRADHEGKLHTHLYCAVFRVAGDRVITCLNPDDVHGVLLRAREPYEFRRGELSPTLGFTVDWPDVEPRGPVDEWLLFFVRHEPLSLHCLETTALALPPPSRDRGPLPVEAAQICCYVAQYRLHPASAASS